VPVKKNISATCPVLIKFQASIVTLEALKGKVWLLHSNGSKSKKIAWSVNNSSFKTTKSKIAFRYQQPKISPWSKRKVWSKLVVTWINPETNKTYKRYSKKAYYNVSCKAGGVSKFR